jgi:hypothetical protein
MLPQFKTLIIHGLAGKCACPGTKYSLEAQFLGVWMYQSFHCALSSRAVLLVTGAIVVLWYPLCHIFCSSVCSFHKHLK